MRRSKRLIELSRDEESEDESEEEEFEQPEEEIETKKGIKWTYIKTFDYNHEFEAYMEEHVMRATTQSLRLSRLNFSCVGAQNKGGCPVRMLIQQSNDGERFFLYHLKNAEHNHPPLDKKPSKTSLKRARQSKHSPLKLSPSKSESLSTVKSEKSSENELSQPREMEKKSEHEAISGGRSPRAKKPKLNPKVEKTISKRAIQTRGSHNLQSKHIAAKNTMEYTTPTKDVKIENPQQQEASAEDPAGSSFSSASTTEMDKSPPPIVPPSSSSLVPKLCFSSPSSEMVMQIDLEALRKSTASPSAKEAMIMTSTSTTNHQHQPSEPAPKEETPAPTTKTTTTTRKNKWNQICVLDDAAARNLDALQAEHEVCEESKTERRIVMHCSYAQPEGGSSTSSSCSYRMQLIKDPEVGGWKLYARGIHTHALIANGAEKEEERGKEEGYVADVECQTETTVDQQQQMEVEGEQNGTKDNEKVQNGTKDNEKEQECTKDNEKEQNDTIDNEEPRERVEKDAEQSVQISDHQTEKGAEDNEEPREQVEKEAEQNVQMSEKQGEEDARDKVEQVKEQPQTEEQPQKEVQKPLPDPNHVNNNSGNLISTVLSSSPSNTFHLFEHRQKMEQMLGTQLGLNLRKEGECLVVSSSNSDLSNRVLVFTDEGATIQVAEFIDQLLEETWEWQKVNELNFLRAAHEKCQAFFRQTT